MKDNKLNSNPYKKLFSSISSNINILELWFERKESDVYTSAWWTTKWSLRQQELSHRRMFLFCNPDVTFSINLRRRGLLTVIYIYTSGHTWPHQMLRGSPFDVFSFLRFFVFKWLFQDKWHANREEYIIDYSGTIFDPLISIVQIQLKSLKKKLTNFILFFSMRLRIIFSVLCKR